MRKDNIIEAFFALVRGGLWEEDVNLSSFGDIDFMEVFRLAEEQSVVGLVAAGLEHVTDLKLPKEIVLQFVGQTLQLEQQNKAMNLFISDLVKSMRGAGIYSILVKGQGVAQCYERPLWRACGDIDFLLSQNEYEKAKQYLTPMASCVEGEGVYERHYGLTIDSWVVELHGNLRTNISSRIDKYVDEIQNDVFYGGSVRSWINGGTHVFLPGANIDVLFIFTHILKHYFRGGIGLRQVCDWCRLMWMYRDTISVRYIENYIRKMGVMSEWHAFACLAVDCLGLPSDVVPFYSKSKSNQRKADKIMSIILETGNMGHNRDMSYQQEYGKVRRKLKTVSIIIKEFKQHLCVFPLDAIMALWRNMMIGIKNIKDGK